MTSRQCLPPHAATVNMMEGLDNGEEDQYLEDSPKIIPLFEVDIVQVLTPYFGEDGEQEILVDVKILKELRLQQEAMEREMHVSQRVQALPLEELNLAENDVEPKIILLVKEMESTNKEKLIDLLQNTKI